MADESLLKEKTPAQLKKEAEKAAKLAKFEEKQKKTEAAKAAAARNESATAAKKKAKAAKEVVNYIADHPIGAKKNTSRGLPTAYDPKFVEKAWYEWWEAEGMFKPEYNEHAGQEPFVVCIPPPNVTGTLHLGHALATSVEDTVARYQRMLGKKVLYNPGCDHSGIATQIVVEKKLQRERGQSRHDLGREKFLDEVWKYKNEKGHIIYEQFRKMGASTDWDRAVFTMDPKVKRAVNEAFIRMHEKGTIHRANRLVNWSCTLRSAISDIEVEKIEIGGATMLSVPGYDQKIEFGIIESFAYPLVDSDEQIIVATTRLETMLGDVAVCVHPTDQRYTHLIGKKIRHPFISGREMTILADDFVEKDFGTGCVKITPAHDPTDYEVGQRHSLPFITILTDEGLITEGCGQFSGMKRFEARGKLAEELTKLGLYHGKKDNPMAVPICTRSKDIVEPKLKSQWFVKCDEMAKKAVEAVESGALKLMPNFHVATWNRWLENIRDWCISRQLWWGHRIPAYFVQFTKEAGKANGDNSDNEYWVSAGTEQEARAKAAKKFNVKEEHIILEWDEDVLDTWFSSGMWPFVVMGWPEKTSDMSKYFPGHFMNTGHDIIFFWIARMVFMSQELTGQLPFNDVFFHAMIRDCHGRKMSKSLGNVIDPMNVIQGIDLAGLNAELEKGNLDAKEIVIAKAGQVADYPNGIPECGTDALRFGLMAYTGQGRDINLDVSRVQSYRYFCNKMWQAVKFSMMHLGENFKPIELSELKIGDNVADKYIISKLAFAVRKVNESFESYKFDQVTTAIYNFWLYDLCDFYLEAIKPTMWDGTDGEKEGIRQILYWCIFTGLQLIAPLMPFISEELWQRLPKVESEKAASIHVSKYPLAEKYQFEDEKAESLIAKVFVVITATRSLRAECKTIGKSKADLFVAVDDQDKTKELTGFEKLIGTLCSAEKVVIGKEGPSNYTFAPTTDEKIKVGLDLTKFTASG